MEDDMPPARRRTSRHAAVRGRKFRKRTKRDGTVQETINDHVLSISQERSAGRPSSHHWFFVEGENNKNMYVAIAHPRRCLRFAHAQDVPIETMIPQASRFTNFEFCERLLFRRPPPWHSFINCRRQYFNKKNCSKSMFQNRKAPFVCLVLFLGTWHTAVCLFGLVAGLMYATTHIYGPTLKFTPKKRSQILDDCSVSTNNIENLLVQPFQGEDEVFYSFDEHGGAIIPSVLSKQTAQDLRDFVENANPKMHQVFVLKQENRFRIMPTPFDHAVVQRAMAEIAVHPTLKPLIDNVLGPKASLIAFSAITSSYGAEAQGWHRDTNKSPMTHPEKFVHELTLTIPLQDTTAEMGATGFCPGTHRCNWISGYKQGEQQEELPCNITAGLKQGDAMIYHTDAIHRGGAHVDPNAPDRIVLFASFAESKQGHSKKRLAYGKVYSLDWRMWGLTIDDFPYLQNFNWKWSYLHPLGWRFFGSSSSTSVGDNIKPWNALDAFLHIFDRPGVTSAHFLDNKFDSKQAKRTSATLILWAIGVCVVYFWIGVPLWVYVISRIFQIRKSSSLPA